jgi:cytochrome c biogenesis protein CcmG, thiol:disulfide interchange protein DsbE
MLVRVKLRWLIAIEILVIVCGVWVYRARMADHSAPAAPKTDSRLAPDFSLSSIDGRPVSLSDWRGRIRLLNFWATWCIPCREEMPEIESAYQTWQDQGFVVLSINETDNSDAVQEFVQTFHPTFPILLDRDGIAAKSYRVAGLPTSIFIDREGAVHIVKVGAVNSTYIESQLVEMGLSPVSRLTALPTSPNTPEPSSTLAIIPTPTRSSISTSTTSRLDMDVLYPPGEGRDHVLEKCAGCHGIVPVAIVRRQMGGWAYNRTTHEEMGLLAGLSTLQIDTMYRYLNEYRNRDVPRQKIPQELLIECDA